VISRMVLRNGQEITSILPSPPRGRGQGEGVENVGVVSWPFLSYPSLAQAVGICPASDRVGVPRRAMGQAGACGAVLRLTNGKLGLEE
jgi:hypothetical protein